MCDSQRRGQHQASGEPSARRAACIGAPEEGWAGGWWQSGGYPEGESGLGYSDRFVLETAMNNELRAEISEALGREAPFEELVDILRRYRDQGGTATAAAETLEAMRVVADERSEDRLLEILDVVAGFCRPELRVWREP